MVHINIVNDNSDFLTLRHYADLHIVQVIDSEKNEVTRFPQEAFLEAENSTLSSSIVEMLTRRRGQVLKIVGESNAEQITAWLSKKVYTPS